MARKLGYGGLSNTNGARSFSGKVAVTITIGLVCASIRLVAAVNGTPSTKPAVKGTPAAKPAVNGTPTLVDC